MFPRLSYLEWMAGRADAAPYDLATTDLAVDGDSDAIVPPRIGALPTPPAGATLEHLLATEYGVQPQQILVTAGATHANFVAAATALEEGGDEVLVERPGYEPLVETPRGLGGTVSRFPRGPGGALDADVIRERVSNDTALVTISNRHNPTGVLVDDADIEGAAEAAAAGDATLLVDEVYAPFVVEEHDGPFSGPSVAGLDDTVVTGSVTKFMGLGDLRIGWLVGPEEFVSRARQVAFHLPDVAGPSRKMAARALYTGDSLVEEQRERVADNHRLLADFVEERDDLAGDVPDGSTFAFVEPTDVAADEVVEAAWEEGVLVAPGRFFGDADRIRIGAGADPTEVEVALGRFAQVLTDVRRTSNS